MKSKIYKRPWRLVSLLLCALLCTPALVWGDVSKVEYWIDSDPGYGSGINMPLSGNNVTTAINTSALAEGMHALGIRAYGNSAWGHTYVRYFYVPSPLAENAGDITGAEYWLDDDPGFGNGVTIPFTADQQTFEFSPNELDTLAFGVHLLGMRVRMGEQWSATYTRSFVHANIPATLTTEAVYGYWDYDTAHVFSIPFTLDEEGFALVQTTLSTEELEYGYHTLAIYATASDINSVVYYFDVCKNAVPMFEFLEENICVGDEVIIIDETQDVQANTTYLWDMNSDGTAEYTDRGDIAHTFTQAGRYTVSLTVQTGEGCESTFSREIYVHAKTAPSVSLSRSKSSICIGDTVTFTATAYNAGENPVFVWLRNGQEIAGAEGTTLKLNDLTHNETVQVKVISDNPCSETRTALSSTLTQTVYDLPDIQLSFANTYYTDQSAFTFSSLATPSGGTFYLNDATVRLFNPQTNAVGSYTIRYEVTNSNGCTAEAETTFVLKERDNATLTVTAGEGGSVNEVSGTYTEGTIIELVATPDEGYRFTGWSDGNTDNPRSLSLDENTTLTAAFEQITYMVKFIDALTQLDIDNGMYEHGTITASPAQATTGTLVTLNVSADKDYALKDIHVYEGAIDIASETITATATTNTGSHFSVVSGSYDSDGWYVNTSYSTTITALNGETISKVELLIGYNSWDGNKSIDHGTVTNTGSGSGTTMTIEDINASSLTITSTSGMVQFKSATIYYEASSLGEEQTLTVVQSGEEYSFIMPANEVIVSAEFIYTLRTITFIDETLSVVENGNYDNGSVSAHPAVPAIGEIVTLNITPNEGYVLDELHVYEGAIEIASETITATGTTNTGSHFSVVSGKYDSDGWYSCKGYTTTISSLNGEKISRVEMLIGYGSWASTNSVSAGTVTDTGSGKGTTMVVDNINATSVIFDNTSSSYFEFKSATIYYEASSLGEEQTLTVVQSGEEYSFIMPANDVSVMATYMAIPNHTYAIVLYLSDDCSEMKPALIGDFNQWTDNVAMIETTDNENRTCYTYSIDDKDGNAFKIREVNDNYWDNQLQYYDVETATWNDFDNMILPAASQDTTLVYDFSNPNLYRFSLCDNAGHDTPTAVSQPSSANAAEVILYHGNIYIRRDGDTYTVQGIKANIE